jgi:hypothetical protein
MLVSNFNIKTTGHKLDDELTAGCQKLLLSYRPSVRRRLGRPLKRLLDEAETCLSIPNS